MVDQAKVSQGSSGHGNGKGPGLVEGITSFSGELINLATLQARLVALEMKQGSAEAVPALVALFGVLLLVVACVVGLVVGLSLWLAARYGWSQGLTLMSVSGAGLLISGLVGGLAVYRLKSSTKAFERSREEFALNIAWLKRILSHPDKV